MKAEMMAEPGLTEAPLATFEIDEFCEEYNDYSNVTSHYEQSAPDDNDNASCNLRKMKESVMVDNFNENFSGSLEDLVSTFDDQITKCFCNFDETTEKIAPVPVRTQDDVNNDCQMWWTITGNFGNILPIDWSKTFAHQNLSTSLNLRQNGGDAESLDLPDDEEFSKAFDMHNIVISSIQQEPLFTADDVINEIDAMMDESDAGDDVSNASSPSGTGTPTSETTVSEELLRFKEEVHTRGIEELSAEKYQESLKSLSVSALNEFLEEVEGGIKDYSEILISELALRDELEYEKELKNHFISLLLSVQNKRRQAATTKLEAMKNRNKNKKQKTSQGSEKPSTYLTTVIPYTKASAAHMDIPRLQILIKILRAIDEDSPQVPPLLTDYILKVLCPNNDNIKPPVVAS